MIKLNHSQNVLWIVSKNQLPTVTDYISSKDNYEGHVMHLKSDNVEVMAYDKDEIIEEFFKSLLYRYQIKLETSMIGSDFIFHSVNLSNTSVIK